MRSKIRSRVVLPKDSLKDSLDHTQFSTMDYIGVSIRHYLGSLSFLEDRDRKFMAKQQEKEMQYMEDIKAALLDSIYRTLVREKNNEVILAVNRSTHKHLNHILSSSDFSPFNIIKLEEDSDVLASFNGLPILLKVTKKILGGD